MSAPRPFTLVAELTYRCPLGCPYCSNPIDFARARGELDAEAWARVFEEAESLGVVQLHLSGGEPLLRPDLERLVARARALDLYVNLVTSGVPLRRERLAALREAGLDHVQLSIQGAEREASDAVAGARVFDRKLAVAAWIKAEGLPLTVNVVLHRENLGRVGAMVELAEELGADRLELANAQYLGFAAKNRAALLPTREAIERAFEEAARARARLEGRMEIIFVKPDYFSKSPRACMDGWARRYVHVTPEGRVLPCHAAEVIPGLRFESVRERGLGEIWESSEALERFRGEAWMKDPCRSCEKRSEDFGGCRCQAYLLAGDAAAADPACTMSPHHGLVDAARREAEGQGKPPRYLHRGAAARANALAERQR